MKTIDTLDPKPFRKLCMTIGELPTSYLESMTYYEMLAWLCEYVSKNVVTTLNNHAKAIKEIQDWLENLDIQEAVDDKIDRMKMSGELAEIITQYLEVHGVLAFNSVAAMKAAENLVDGSFVQTYGFYSAGDGGGAKYKVREVTNQDDVDEMFLIALEDVNLVAELIYKNVDLLQLGIKINDSNEDSSSLIQNAIDKIYSNKGGKIFFPKGSIYIKSTVLLKPEVELVGYGDYSTWNGNAGVYTDKGTVIYFTPNTVDNLFEVDNSILSVGYTPNINLKNMYIIGDENSNIAVKYSKVAKGCLKNLMIQGFVEDLDISGCMLCSFKNCYFQQSSDKCCSINRTNGQNTTLDFYKCYFGQTIVTGGNPLYIDSDSVINASFNECCFESSNKSIYLDTDNIVSFQNIYTENIPESGSEPTFKIGNSSPTTVRYGVYSFDGGIIQGTNSVIKDPMTVFSVNYADELQLSGMQIARSRHLFSINNSNTKAIVCNAVNAIQIQNVFDEIKDSGKITWINCTSTSTTLNPKTFIPKQNLGTSQVTLQNSWTAYQSGARVQSQGNRIDFVFSSTAGTVTQGTTIGLIPDGFRPTVSTIVPTCDVSYSKNGGLLTLEPNGAIKIRGTDFEAGHVYQASISYPSM